MSVIVIDECHDDILSKERLSRFLPLVMHNVIVARSWQEEILQFIWASPPTSASTTVGTFVIESLKILCLI
jgi:hypothetical protein